MGLCALSDVKAWLDIPTGTTTYDAKLQLMIDTVSAQMSAYLGYNPARTTYTNEVHTINNNQVIFLDAQPIQSITSVTIQGQAITAGTTEYNYYLTTQDARIGRLYLGVGWIGRYFVRGMTYDPVSGYRDILVSYVGGWYLPGDVSYDKANAQSGSVVTASLPYGISKACIDEVVILYRRNAARAEGLTSYKEGEISWGYQKHGNAGESGDNSGLSVGAQAILNPYKKWSIA